MTTRFVHCSKLKQSLEALDRPPFPGADGQRIYDCISKQAWQEWLNHQTILINEYRLTSLDPKARVFLAEEREKFLFGDGIELPEQFNPIEHPKS